MVYGLVVVERLLPSLAWLLLVCVVAGMIVDELSRSGRVSRRRCAVYLISGRDHAFLITGFLSASASGVPVYPSERWASPCHLLANYITMT